MNFDFSDDSKLLREQAQRFLREHCTPKVVRHVMEGHVPYSEALWLATAIAGLPSEAAAVRLSRRSFVDTYEAGVVLMGTEVKALREGRASLVDGFATIDDGEVFLRNVHIPEYFQASWTNHEPRRTRKLLLHRGEILRLVGKTKESRYEAGRN